MYKPASKITKQTKNTHMKVSTSFWYTSSKIIVVSVGDESQDNQAISEVAATFTTHCFHHPRSTWWVDVCKSYFSKQQNINFLKCQPRELPLCVCIGLQLQEGVTLKQINLRYHEKKVRKTMATRPCHTVSGQETLRTEEAHNMSTIDWSHWKNKSVKLLPSELQQYESQNRFLVGLWWSCSRSEVKKNKGLSIVLIRFLTCTSSNNNQDGPQTATSQCSEAKSVFTALPNLAPPPPNKCN